MQGISPHLETYMTEEGFDLPRLINDDFFLAIRICFNNGYYISASKLLLSFIDTISFIEYGESRGYNFQRWLREYTDIRSLGITEEELWEHRNSLLHMSNLESRQVIRKRVRRIVAYVGEFPEGISEEDSEVKYYSLWGLINVIIEGVEKLCAELSRDPEKTKEFLERYDLIASDTRLIEIELSES